ncbi:DUF3883 domain-containing protein [bacterium]|nr:DUF3883 domain-containing protein [bacterium]
MLYAELRGESYNKTGHRRRLLPLLDDRSEAAIERKHGNISAVLIGLGFPYIAGYKPYANYQRLLAEIVEERLAGASALRRFVAADVDRPADVPTVEDILRAEVGIPTRSRRPSGGPSQPWGGHNAKRPKIDYLRCEAENQRLGLAGEHFVVEFERARLEHAGHGSLAARVEHKSQTVGDGIGFDVLSYDESGRERLIEVKTTRYGALTPFFATQGEVRVSEEASDLYCVYRVHEFRRAPKLFVARGAISEIFEITPRVYSAQIRCG